MKAGLKPVSTWVSTSRHSDRHFGGPIGALEVYANSGNKTLGQALSLLNIYTSFYSPTLTSSQVRKFVSAVYAPSEKSEQGPLERKVRLAVGRAGLKPRKKLRDASPLLFYLPSDSKWAPTPFGRRPEESGIVDSLSYLQSKEGRRHYQRYRHLYTPVLQGLEKEMMIGAGFLPASHKEDFCVGRIGLIQEAGFKLRAVANPGRIFQQVLAPLGEDLFRTLKGLPWDCTFDQSKGDAALRSATTDSERTVHSVDLSNATDFFPLSLQLEVLHALYPHQTDLVNLFVEVSRAYWETNLPDVYVKEFGESKTGRLRWSKGQPLGLYPSFASFALTHGLLLLGLLGRDWDEDFFILGDDVVILDDTLYADYLHAMEVLGCPVSPQKTISASNVAEFHSSIFIDGEKIPNFKWRRPSDDSFLDIVRLVGPKMVPLLPERQAKVVKAVAPLPESLGGLGWNPKGLSLSERMDPWMPYLIRDKQGLAFLTDYSGYIRRALWQSSIAEYARKLDFSVNSEISSLGTFDQKVQSLISSLLGSSLVPLRGILGQNLREVVDDNVVDLPIPGVRTLSRVTTLQKMEGVISSLNIGV
jgi:hypothetical protein